jgi:DNA-binding NarL/FixJ family response regulator
MNYTQPQQHGAINAKILALLTEGLLAKQIAKETGLSEIAVHSRLFRIRQKEGVDSNIALVGRILEARWKNQSKSKGRSSAA